ncbi:bifunctional phosphoribosylaminoimidazolecarboxamide formyltransferase/IMP cyclohydrolase [Legionella taurinensis]|uniref:bifunctional phosphoribosylaminoimidazolecarboxamide formyltransferase/IMP cyclohydrolase n=1 Tax=Legionella taurinensis TaxID=70611 RepID=UPI000DFDD46B|nr:bifunctional phosphoribosylaminoimidazolecarboxamide formyltransferase/IMP cyclohydrolase [Legionella taurinensis]MDX1837674.1 bifunctional phosphoribosylaminoimidazolecarboxamide formyltransferase/IMP cyclohydrolase [Legionella taurinensis]STY27018.1 phosphoribosylaminoimidazolecarboxamide formyltransferase [Legionella taurinensis]
MTELPFTPRRALLSVSDKRGLVELGQRLIQHGIEIIATGNTAASLRAAGITVTEVSERTGFPEIMDGRVKTLHPAIHAALLARGEQDHAILEAQGITPIDLVIVNLYPFEQTVSQSYCTLDDAIATIDIGGPTMIRAAAKNHEHVAVIVSPEDYDALEQYLSLNKMPADWRLTLAKKAFAHTAAYDAAISNYLNSLDDNKKTAPFPTVFSTQFQQCYELRYGENPHQQAAFYANKQAASDSLAKARLLQGKPLSYNNLLDADAALDCVKALDRNTPACVIVKHGNPCGIAARDTLIQAYQRAFETDPTSSFGGILAFNYPVDEETAQRIIDNQFAEVLIAPAFSEQAKAVLLTKPNVRVLATGQFNDHPQPEFSLRTLSGGLLVQDSDHRFIRPDELKAVTQRQPTPDEWKDLLFAWQAVKYVKSNAIVFAKEQATVGIGAGQTSRVMSTRIAAWQAEQAGFSLQGAVMASDAFIPFADNIEIAAKAGVTAIIQPGGSLRDQQVIDAANAANLTMIFTGIRHFRH